MASSTFCKLCFITIFFFIQFHGQASAQLSPNFYSTSCPQAMRIIKAVIRTAVSKEPRMGASLLRLHFHDCFVNGCEASVLLDDTATFKGEKSAGGNINSLRGFEVVDAIKSRLEKACPGVFSCADILAVAARDSVVALGGPAWIVPLGRRDSTTASLSAANSNIPSAALNLSNLVSFFAKKGLTASEMVALSGSHTIGMSRCVVFRTRIYTEKNINTAFAASLKQKCPSKGGNNNLSPLNPRSANVFDNTFYTNLINQKGLLHSDQALFSGAGGSIDAQVKAYSANSAAFFRDFGKAMVKMGNISPLTGTQGVIRTNCRKPH